jgi:hypothetical protein
MKKLFFLILSIFVLSCSSDGGGPSTQSWKMDDVYVGEWNGEHHGRPLHIEQHKIILETDTGTVTVTSATQMMQDDNENHIGLDDGTYIRFEQWSLYTMLVTWSDDDGTLYQDFYGKEH